MNCMEGMTCSAGMPLSAWIFLYSSSASFGAPASDPGLGGVDCPRASAIPITPRNKVPQTKIQLLERKRFMNSTLAGYVTKVSAKWLQQVQEICGSYELISPRLASAVMRSAARK